MTRTVFALLLLSSARVSDALSTANLPQLHGDETNRTAGSATMQPTAPSAAELSRAGPATLTATPPDLNSDSVREWARNVIKHMTPDSELGIMFREKGLDAVADVLARMYLDAEANGTLTNGGPLAGQTMIASAPGQSTAAHAAVGNETISWTDESLVDPARVREWGLARIKTLSPELRSVLQNQGSDALADLLTSMYLEEEARNGSAALATAVSQKTTVSTAAPNTTTVVADAAPTAQKLAANDTVANADAPAALVVAPVVPNTTTVVTDVALKAQKLAANGTVANAAAAATPSETTRTADSSIANATVAALATAAAEPKLAVKESNTTADTAHTLPSHDTAAATDPAQTASSAASTAATASDAPAVAPAAATAAPTTMAAVATPAAATATATGAIVPSAAAGSPSKAQQ